MDHAHSAIEPGKKISMSKFHQTTGHTGEHLLRPTAKYMKIELTGKLAPCEICAQAKIMQANVKRRNYQPGLDTGYSLTSAPSNKLAEGETGTG